MENTNLKRIPKIGEILPSFDDGKVRLSRLYVTEILDVVPFEKAKDLQVYGIDKEISDEMCETTYRGDINLIDAWEYEKKDIYWLFADETDFFIHAKVKEDVHEDQWFARTKDGGWFSMSIANYMIGARLDSDMSLFNSWKDDKYFSADYWRLVETFKMLD